jgi:hypothetical protein
MWCLEFSQRAMLLTKLQHVDSAARALPTYACATCCHAAYPDSRVVVIIPSPLVAIATSQVVTPLLLLLLTLLLLEMLLLLLLLMLKLLLLRLHAHDWQLLQHLLLLPSMLSVLLDFSAV